MKCGARENLTILSESDAPSSGNRIYFWSVFTALETLFLLITVLSYNKHHIHILLFLYLFSFLPFLLSLHLGPKITLSIRSILLTGLILRLTLLGSFPVFSDDVFRYLWEGKMQLHGSNPYIVAPADPSTAPFRDAYFELVNHKTIPTIYPPLSELFFRVCMGISYNLYFFKVVLILLDMGVLIFLHKMLKYRGMKRHLLLVWAWHPLIIIEIAGSGHQDIIGIFFLTGSLYLMQQKHLLKSALMLIGSFLSKLFPLFLFPLLLRRQKKWPYLVLLLMTTLFYLPFFSTESHLFTGLSVYTRTWEANASIFYLLRFLLKDLQATKFVIILIFLSIYLYAYRSISKFETAGFVILGSFLLLTPTLHPWYILWVIPFLVINPNRAWLYLTMASTAYYHVLIDYFEKDLWQEQLWIKCLIYLPFFVLLILEHLKKRRISNASHPF